MAGPSLPGGIAGQVHVVRDVVYRDLLGRSSGLDLFLPPGPAPPGGRPVVLAIHGGGWRKFSKEQYEPTARRALARLGFIVAVPDYRLSRPGAPSWPVNLDELRGRRRLGPGPFGRVRAT